MRENYNAPILSDAISVNGTVLHITTPVITANSQIKAKCADSIGGKTVTISLGYRL